MIIRAVLFDSFAGRRSELDHLSASLERAGRECRGELVSIAGEAGVGKSRLLSEFEATSGQGTFVRSRCEELPVAYAPFVCALEQLARRRELRRCEALPRALELATTATGNGPAAERKRAIFSAIVEALSSCAQRLGRLALVLEDVHWSDLSSLEAARFLARSCEHVPLLSIVTYRPEALASDAVRAAAVADIEREGADRMVLGPLSFGEMSELLRATIPDAGPTAMRNIYDLSEGRPYVAEELARSVVERGADGDLEASLNLRGAVLERVARLAPGDREIIERASVLGRNFAAADLRALGYDDARLIGALRAGLEQQLLEEREEHGVPWFRFRHALTREILYRSLIGMERRALHREIAAGLSNDETRVAEYAYHTAAAGDGPSATEANERAGDRAGALAAHGDAAALFARALDFARDPQTCGRLGRKLAESLERTGDVERMLASIPPLLDRLERQRPEDALAILIVTVRAVLPTRLPQSIALMERANALLEPGVAAELRFEVEMLNATILRMQHRGTEALEANARAEAALARPTAGQANSLHLSRAYGYLHLGDVGRAEAELDARASERATDPAEEAKLRVALAMVAWRRGRLREAFLESRRAAESWERAGHERAAYLQRCSAAFFAADLGEFDYVDAVAERTRRDGIDPGQTLEAARMRALRARGGDVGPLLDRFEAALQAGAPFLAHAFGRDLPFVVEDRALGRSIALRAFERVPPEEVEGSLVEAVVAFGDRSEVERALAVLDARADAQSDGVRLAEASLARSRAALRAARPIEARRFAEAALESARGSQSWLAVASACELAGDLDGARAEFQRVGATAELARFERRRTGAAGSPAEVAIGQTRLTPRERQIARLSAAGLSSREVAERLGIGRRTVETHLGNVYMKLGISSRGELPGLLGA